MQQLLEGVTVLDFTQAFSGPYCALTLADYGARVIKIERKGVGDQSRYWLPLAENGNSVYFAQYNRNKESIALDLRTDEGREIIYRLVEDADIVLENFKTGSMEKLGLSYEALRSHKPDIIYASLTGYGQYGPDSHLAAYDNIIEATCGLMERSGFPDSNPVRCGASVGDSYTGLMLAFAISAAYYHKLRTGEGQQIDVAMQDCLFHSAEDAILAYTVAGQVLPRSGNSAENRIAPYGVYACKDGWVSLGTASEDGFAELCHGIGRAQLQTDPRFLTNELRCQNNAALNEEITGFFADKTRAELMASFPGHTLAVSPIYNAAEAMETPHLQAREMVPEVDDRNIGRFRTMGIPIKFEKTPGTLKKSSPRLGENSDEVLRGFGYTAAEIAQLRDKGIVAG